MIYEINVDIKDFTDETFHSGIGMKDKIEEYINATPTEVNAFKITVNLESKPFDQTHFGSILGNIMNRHSHFRKLAYIEYCIYMPSTITVLGEINGMSFVADQGVIRFFGSNVTKVEKLLSTVPRNVYNIVSILDLRGLVNCTELHYLFTREYANDYSGTTVYHILYPSEKIVDISYWLNPFAHYPQNSLYFSSELIQEFLYHKWPKLKRAKHFIDLPNYAYSQRSPDFYKFTGEIFPADAYPKKIYDFKNLPVIEDLSEFYYEGQHNLNYFIDGWSIVNLSPKAKCSLYHFIYSYSNNDHAWHSAKINTLSCKNLDYLSNAYLFVQKFIQVGSCSSLPSINAKAPILLTDGNINSYDLNDGAFQSHLQYINTGDPSLDNQLTQTFKHAKAGVPAGWTHIFAAT